MAAKIPPQKVADCRELYFKYGGQSHARIVSEMRARGWTAFTKRNLYVRTRNGRVELGWPERFGWERDLPTKGTKSTKRGGLSRPRRLRVSAVQNRRSRPGVAYAHRRASERTVIDRPSALIVPKPKFNRQKARSLRLDAKRPFRDLTAESQRRGEQESQSKTTNGIELIQRHDHNAQIPSSQRLGVSAAKSDPDPPDFHAWLQTLPSIWKWDARHQLYLYEQLQLVTDGKVKRLMIFMPPRHGKSELVTVRYTAYCLKRDPSMNVILASYNQDLANRFSRKIKRVLSDDWTAAELRNADCGIRIEESTGIQRPQNPGSTRKTTTPQSAIRNPHSTGSPFPFTRSRPANRVSEWETTCGGGLRAVGIGAGVTGYGANLIVIDDPVKSREQANSRRFRDRLWDWYNDDLHTRLEPDGSIILIQTRWHQDDLAGRLLQDAKAGGAQWTVINLPALAEESAGEEEKGSRGVEEKGGRGEEGIERNAPSADGSLSPLLLFSPSPLLDPLGRRPGEALWPERFDAEYFDEIRRRQGEMSFASLYQQRPVPAEGGVFKREWFTHIVEYPPPGLKWKRGYDLAVSIKETADYTASFRVAYDADGNLYIDGGFRRRIGFPEQRRYITERLAIERDTEHGIERSLHGQAMMQELRNEARNRGRRFVGIDARGDKQTRAGKWQTLAADGRIRLVRGGWNQAFVEETCSFPNSAHDDQVDAVSIAVSMFEKRAGKLLVF